MHQLLLKTTPDLIDSDFVSKTDTLIDTIEHPATCTPVATYVAFIKCANTMLTVSTCDN